MHIISIFGYHLPHEGQGAYSGQHTSLVSHFYILVGDPTSFCGGVCLLLYSAVLFLGCEALLYGKQGHTKMGCVENRGLSGKSAAA